MVPDTDKAPQARDPSPRLVAEIRELIATARQQVVQTVNSTMVQTYWHIGRLIVEEEQQGESRATYGKQQLQRLSGELTHEFGKGFDVTNLRNMRRFYEAFPKRDALRPELSWSHYNHLARIENSSARTWCQQEAIQQGWSASGAWYSSRLSRPRCGEQRMNKTVLHCRAKSRPATGFGIAKQNEQMDGDLKELGYGA